MPNQIDPTIPAQPKPPKVDVIPAAPAPKPPKIKPSAIAQGFPTAPPAPVIAPPTLQPAVTPPDPATDKKDWQTLIGNRVEKMPLEFLVHSPDVAAQLVASRLSEKNLLAAANNYVPMHDWIAQQNKLGGVPGALINARLKAINIVDPQARIDALNTINDIARLSDAEQQMWLSYAANPSSIPMLTTPGTVGFHGIVTPGTEVSGAQAAVSTILPGATVDASGMTTVNSTDVTIQQVVALENIFPSLKGKIHFSEMGVNLEDFRIDLTNNILNRTYSVWGLQAPQITGDVVTGGVAEGQTFKDLRPTGAAFGLAMGYLQYGTPIGRFISLGIPGVGAAANLAAQALPDWAGKAQAQDAVMFAGSHTRQLESFIGTSTQVLGKPVADLLQKTPGTKEYEDTANIAGGLILAGLLHLTTESLGALKTTYTTADIGAAANLNLPLTDGAAGIFDAIDASRELSGVKASVIHPMRVFIDPIVKAVIYNLHNLPADVWVKGGLANDVFDAMDKFLRDDPAKAQASMLERYPGMDVRLIDRLANAGGREFMPDAAIEYYHGNGILDKAEISVKQREITKLSSKNTNTVSPKILDTEMIANGDQPAFEALNPATLPPGEAGISYHATLADNLTGADGIAEKGLVPGRTRPGEPAGVHWSDSPQAIADVLPTDQVGSRVLLRAQNDIAGINQGISDAVPSGNIQFLSSDGSWRPVSDLQGQNPLEASIDQARILELQGQLADAATARIEYKFPGGNSLPQFMHRVLIHPETGLEHMLNRILNPGRYVKQWSNDVFGTSLKVAETSWLGKFTNKIDFAPKLFDVSSSSAPLDAIDQNVTVLNRYLKRLGFEQSEITTISQRFLDVKSQQDFFESMDKLTQEIDAHLPTNTPLSVRQQMTALTKRSQDQYMMGYRDPVTGIIEPLVPGKTVEGTPDALPSAPNEFINHANLPNLELLDEATSTLRRLVKNAQSDQLSPKEITSKAKRIAKSSGIPLEEATARVIATNGAGLIGRFAAETVDFGRAILHLSTGVLKPISLVMKIPAIILRKELDEGLGNSLTPGTVGATRTSSQLIRDTVGPVDPGVIGSGVQGAMEHITGTPVIDNVPLADLVARGKGADPVIWASRVNELRFLNADPILRRFAAEGLDVERMKAILSGEDTTLTQLFNENTAKSLAQARDGAGMTIDEWLTRTKASMLDTTLNDTELMNFVRTGHVYVGGSVDHITAAKYGRLQDESAAISKRLSELPDTDPQALALANEQKAILNRINDIESLHDGPISLASISKTQERAMASYLHDRWDSGDLTMPKNIRVTRYTSDSGYAPASITEHLNSWATQFSTAVYNKFAVIGRMEAQFAKGSFYEQRAYQYYQEYLAGGVNEDTALALAHIKAGNATRDIMYDMSARSSLERSTRNVFWYAPVTGELMHRWLYAIPAQSGAWLPGLAMTALKAANYFELAKNIGIIHKDANGQWVVPIPGAAKFISTITGHQIRLPSELNVPLESLSHLSFSLPSLGTLPGFGLTQLAKHNQAAYDMSKILDPYGQSTEIVPSAIRYAAEMFGMKIPDLNPDYIDSQYNQIHNQALQFAVSDLENHGVTQPDRANFQNDAAYIAAWTTWHDRVNVEADQYARGMFFFKTLQATVIPGTISMTTPDKEAFQTFFTTKIIPQYDSPGYTAGSAESAKIKSELLKWYAGHPGSQAFAVSYNWYTGKDWHAPVEATSDEAFRLLYLHGVKDTMTIEQYQAVLPALMSKNAYDAVQNAQLQQIAPDSLGPDKQAAALLADWGSRRQVMQDAAEKWQTYQIGRAHV